MLQISGLANNTQNYYGVTSVPKRQNGLSLIFEKIELGAFSESLRPSLSIAGPIMTLAGL